MVEEDPDYKTYYETDDDNNSHIPVVVHITTVCSVCVCVCV